MSAGIRSGVNCTRFWPSPRTTPRVSASLVLASPGTPTSSAWPPARTVISVSWTTPSCPKMTRPISCLTRSSSAMVASIAAAMSAFSSVMSVIGDTQNLPESGPLPRVG